MSCKDYLIDWQATAEQAISLTKATYIVSNKLKNKKNNNNFYTKSSGIKTVSLNELSMSTKSWGQNSSKQLNQNNSNDLINTFNASWLPNSTDKPNIMKNKEQQIKAKSNFWLDLENQKPKLLNSTKNNNSLSSLKLNDKNLLIDLGNQSKYDPYYSPVSRERSNTINSNNEMKMNNWRSSNTISSNGKISSSKVKQLDSNISSTPYSNLLSSSKIWEKTVQINEEESNPSPNIQERLETFETSWGITNKSLAKSRATNLIKNNIDVQKVREAILGSIDISKSEFRAYEKRKMRFLNSLDESKDWDLFRQRLGYFIYIVLS